MLGRSLHIESGRESIAGGHRLASHDERTVFEIAQLSSGCVCYGYGRAIETKRKNNVAQLARRRDRHTQCETRGDTN